MAKRKIAGPGQGLYLQRTRNAESWIYRYMLRGKRRHLGLGSREEVSLDLARRLAAEASTLRAQGIDPLDQKEKKEVEARTAELKAKTFEAVAAEYIAIKLPGWKNRKSRQSWEGTLRDYVNPLIGSLPVAEIDAAHILSVLNQVVDDRHGAPTTLWLAKPETASRVRGRIEMVLSFAMSPAKGYRPKGPDLRH